MKETTIHARITRGSTPLSPVRRIAGSIGLGALALVVMTFAGAGLAHLRASNPTPAGMETETAATAVQSPITTNALQNRLILLKFEDGVTAEQMAAVKRHFCALGRSQAGLDQVVWIEDRELCGTGDYTHAVLLSFSCPESAATYRENAECRAFETESVGIVAKSVEMKFRLDATNVSRPAGA